MIIVDLGFPYYLFPIPYSRLDAVAHGGFPRMKALHQDNDNNGTFSYPPHPIPHTPQPTPEVKVKNLPL
ncbi:hypothetical protein [Moorena sp. SIO3H5]|uniref:hypothetical protein n=1 Tax=Moorena sp. SIO3H5 TaxID=2607834 RepID=UPI0013BDC4E2|nr:hypothetical protein [Moorena sp. SIO3H5]NEO73106.1 hypothetical protein [Moorena sp. SIO3H5]